MTARVFILMLGILLAACSVTGAAAPVTNDLGEVAQIWPGADEAVDAEPVLQWGAFPEAAQYRVAVVDADAGGVAFSGTTAEPVMPVTPPLPRGVNYRWTVLALDANGDPIGEVSSFFRFKAGLNAVWPSNGESVDGRPILQWEPFPGTEQYTVIVVDDDAYPPFVAFEQSTTETQMEVTPELPAGSYSWTVRGTAADGAILAELNSQFFVKAPLVLIEPANGETVSPNPLLEWQAYPDAVSYQIIILDDDAYPPVVVVDEATSDSSFAIPLPLESGSYSWTVWARDANGRVVAELNSQFVVGE